MTWADHLPAFNATLNLGAFSCLVAGLVFIRKRRIEEHRRCMLTAVGLSGLFLCSYVVYHFAHGATPFPGHGVARIVYFSVLFTHTPLALLLLPFILVTVRRGLRDDRRAHRRIARWTLPVWMYVSSTGVVIYWMLYRVHWE